MWWHVAPVPVSVAAGVAVCLAFLPRRRRKPYAMRRVAGKGVVLAAAVELPPGSVVLAERAVISVQCGSGGGWRDTAAEAFRQFLRLPAAVRDAVMSLSGTADPDHHLHLPALPKGIDFLAADLWVPFVSRWRVNAVLADGSSCAAELYVALSRVSHSCAPNCSWLAVDGKRQLRTIRTVERGEELSVTYIGTASLLRPKSMRQAELLTGWHFLCACQRCSAPVDDARSARCPRCGGRAVATTTDFAPCGDCGAAIGSEEAAAVKRDEGALVAGLGQVQEALTSPVLDAEDLRRLAKDLSSLPTGRLHPSHGLAGAHALLLCQLCLELGDRAAAAAAARREVDCRLVLLPGAHRDTAFAAQRLAAADRDAVGRGNGLLLACALSASAIPLRPLHCTRSAPVGSMT
eukprot:TRINITY_DN25718_c0_g1_i1.p1 TRINITY_DN25718_c0_g1~~TRINITY_DN25718_c0_g1_i1.p1  ORF type:complete len:420 (+),score=123.18 TRINITY_DN25718_c0_g1_i1:46-1260(+)